MWVQSYDFFFISSLSETNKNSTETNIFRNLKEPLLTKGPPRSLRRLRRLLGGRRRNVGGRPSFSVYGVTFKSDTRDNKTGTAGVFLVEDNVVTH